MQESSFTREPIVVVSGSTSQLPSTDLFLLAHSRLEWSQDQVGVNFTPKVLPIAKGVVVKGIHHRTLLSYVPEISPDPTANTVGFVTVHMAILRLPTAVDLTPLEVPNLYRTDVADSPTGPISVPNKYRTLWRGLEHIRVFNGTVSSFQGAALDYNDRRDFSQISFIRTKSSVTLSMEQGLFLLVQCVSPFAESENPDETVTLGLDTFSVAGVKQMTRGTTYP